MGIIVKVTLVLLACVKAFPTLEDQLSLVNNQKETERGKQSKVTSSLPVRIQQYQVPPRKVWDKANCTSLKVWKNLTVPDCGDKMIINNMCGGLCPSIAYPYGKKVIRECSACQPTRIIQKSFVFCCTENSKKKCHVVTYGFVQGCECRKMNC